MCHVLIIEDEPLVAMAIQDILALQGATSFEIVDTEEAAVSAAAATEPKRHNLRSSVALSPKRKVGLVATPIECTLRCLS